MLGKCRIAEQRKKVGLTQEVLARMVDVSRTTIVSLETMKFYPTLNLAYKLSVCLDCKITDLYDFYPDDILAGWGLVRDDN